MTNSLLPGLLGFVGKTRLGMILRSGGSREEIIALAIKAMRNDPEVRRAVIAALDDRLELALKAGA